LIQGFADSLGHGYFRALTSSSSAATGDDPRKSRIDLPLIERASKYLISPHLDCSRAEVSWRAEWELVLIA
jgi:hypothetical protein